MEGRQVAALDDEGEGCAGSEVDGEFREKGERALRCDNCGGEIHCPENEKLCLYCRQCGASICFDCQRRYPAFKQRGRFIRCFECEKKMVEALTRDAEGSEVLGKVARARITAFLGWFVGQIRDSREILDPLERKKYLVDVVDPRFEEKNFYDDDEERLDTILAALYVSAHAVEKARNHVPRARALEFKVEDQGFFKKTAIVNLHALAVTRYEAFAAEGRDSRPLDLDHLNDIIESYQKKTHREGKYYVVGIFSPTGWSDDCREVFEALNERNRLKDSYLSVYLLGEENSTVCFNEGDPYAVYFSKYFRTLKIDEILEARLSRHPVVSEPDLVRETGADRELVRKAFDRFAKKAAYSLVAEKQHPRLLVNVEQMKKFLKERLAKKTVISHAELAGELGIEEPQAEKIMEKLDGKSDFYILEKQAPRLLVGTEELERPLEKLFKGKLDITHEELGRELNLESPQAIRLIEYLGGRAPYMILRDNRRVGHLVSKKALQRNLPLTERNLRDDYNMSDQMIREIFDFLGKDKKFEVVKSGKERIIQKA